MAANSLDRSELGEGGFLFYGTLLALLTTFCQSFVIWKLWHWFVVPSLNWPALAWNQVLGIMFVIQTLTIKSDTPRPKDTKPQYLVAILAPLWYPPILLLIGYLLH